MKNSNNPCPEVQVTEQIKQYFDSRSQLGWDKYGITMDREDLTSEEWCTHAIDELADGMQYLWKLRATLAPAKLKERAFQPLNATRVYDDLCIEDKVYFADEEHELHLAIICGFVADPEDGNLVVIQTGYNWMAVSFDTLYEECK